MTHVSRPTASATLQVEVGLQIGPVKESILTDLTSDEFNNRSDGAETVSQCATDLLEPQLWQDWISMWLSYLEPRLSPINAYELGILLTDDRDIQRFNRDFRHQDEPTDVLSFATADDDAAPDWLPDCPVYLGDIVISIETAKRQARDRSHSLIYELAQLAAHGVLHLLGWDHPDDAQLERMLHQQNQLLSEVGFNALH